MLTSQPRFAPPGPPLAIPFPEKAALALCCLLLSLLPGQPASAAEPLVMAALSEEDFLDDIPVVLTATRLAQPITEAPAAITIIDKKMIRASGAREIAELFRMVPGFVVSHDSGHQPIVSYHGLNDEYAQRLQVLVDGRSVYSPLFGGVDWTNLPLAMDDIEYIEVIRGPNSASYGSNSFLSIINIVTQHASETTGAFARAVRGSNGIKDVYARYGHSLGDFDYRVTAGIINDDGFRTRADHKRMKNARFRGDYQINNRDSLLLETGLTRGTRGIDSLTLSAVEDRKVKVNFEQLRWSRQVSDDESLSLQFFHTLEDTRQIFDVLLPPFGIHPIVNSSSRSERFDLELQHSRHLQEDKRLVWGLGLRQDSTEGPHIFGTDPATGYTGSKHIFYNQLGRIFGNLEWRLAKKLTLNLGAMWEVSDLADKEFSPRIGLNYSFTPEQSVRWIYSRASRTPSLNEAHSNFRFPVDNYPVAPTSFVSTVWVGNPSIDPEKITSLELGYHANLVRERLSFDIKVFKERLRDLITLDGNATPNPSDPLLQKYETYDNLTDAEVRGIEANLEISPLSNTRIILSRSLTDIQSKNPNISSEKLEDSAPRHITSIMMINQFPGGATGSLLFYRVSDSNGLGSGDPLPGYKHVNLRLALPLAWNGLKGEIAFVVQNATGDYLDWRSDNTAEPQQYLSLSAEWD